MKRKMASSDLNQNSYPREKQVKAKTFSRHRRQTEFEIRRALHRFAAARWPRKRWYGLSDTHYHVQQQPELHSLAGRTRYPAVRSLPLRSLFRHAADGPGK